MNFKLLIYSSFLFVIFSCKKAEIPVKKHEAGNVISNSFEMGSDYRNQAYFDLGTNSFVSQNLKTTWDLGFENGANGWHIYLNGANLMGASKVENRTFSQVTDTVGIVWDWDSNTGHIDSTAIGDWRNSTAVYIIDRGMNHLGIHRGFSKVQFQSVSATDYSFKVSDLDGTNLNEVTIQKNNELNEIAYSISSNNIVSVEPPKENWDLAFTQYTYYFYEHELAYLVTGILINKNKVEVAKVFDKSFDEITSETVSTYDFSTEMNVIGYEWKFYDFDTSTYLTRPSKNYIIKTTEGVYYKLHFLDFYNNQGDKGTPTFELQAL